MTLYQFNALPPEERYDLTWNKATYLSWRNEEFSNYNLYYLGEFFIEVQYNFVENKIIDLRTFKSASQLEPYLDLIQVEL